MSARPLRVAFDARSLTSPVVRGWDRYTIGLVAALRRRGVEVTLLCRGGAPVHADHAARLACPVREIGGRAGMWWEQAALPLALRDFDVYHAPAEHGVPLLAPCPVVLTLHSATAHSYADLIARGLLPGRLEDYLGADLDPHAPTAANTYWRAQVARADAVIAPSAFARGEIIRFLAVPADRVTAIPLAVDDVLRTAEPTSAERARTLERLGVHPPYLLYVGGYEPHKNPAGLIAAFARVHARRPDLQLVLVGSRRPEATLAAAAAARGLAPERDVLLLTGLGDELPALYDGAELFVSLSWRESFGLPALEAMTRGIAVVASAWGAAPEVVDGGGTLVDPRDHDAFAEAVARELADPARGSRARSAAARFHWDEIADATLDVYRRAGAPAHQG